MQINVKVEKEKQWEKQEGCIIGKCFWVRLFAVRLIEVNKVKWNGLCKMSDVFYLVEKRIAKVKRKCIWDMDGFWDMKRKPHWYLFRMILPCNM